MNCLLPNIALLAWQMSQVVTPAYLSKWNDLTENTKSKNNNRCLFSVHHMPNTALSINVHELISFLYQLYMNERGLSLGSCYSGGSVNLGPRLWRQKGAYSGESVQGKEWHIWRFRGKDGCDVWGLQKVLKMAGVGSTCEKNSSWEWKIHSYKDFRSTCLEIPTHMFWLIF